LLLLLFSLSPALAHTNNDRAPLALFNRVPFIHMYALHGANNQLARRTLEKSGRSFARSLATKTYCLIKILLSTFSQQPFFANISSSCAKRQGFKFSTWMLLKQGNYDFWCFLTKLF
jgi:hypothetical protein